MGYFLKILGKFNLELILNQINFKKWKDT